MANETEITIIGNMVRDPEMRFTQNGDAVCRFAIAATPRVMDRNSNEWKDGDTLFMECTAWRQLAEHIASSIDGGFRKGTRVIAQGSLKQRSYEVDGQKRTVIEMTVNEIGPSLRYATVGVMKAAAGGGNGGQGRQQQRGSDEWESAAPAQSAPAQRQQAPAQAPASAGSDDW